MPYFTDGLVWGASTLVAVGFGIKKLQINLVVEDEKISLDDLQQEIEGDEDHVQSTDVSSSLPFPISHNELTYLGNLGCCYAKVVNGRCTKKKQARIWGEIFDSR